MRNLEPMAVDVTHIPPSALPCDGFMNKGAHRPIDLCLPCTCWHMRGLPGLRHIVPADIKRSDGTYFCALRLEV